MNFRRRLQDPSNVYLSSWFLPYRFGHDSEASLQRCSQPAVRGGLLFCAAQKKSSSRRPRSPAVAILWAMRDRQRGQGVALSQKSLDDPLGPPIQSPLPRFPSRQRAGVNSKHLAERSGGETPGACGGAGAGLQATEPPHRDWERALCYNYFAFLGEESYGKHGRMR